MPIDRRGFLRVGALAVLPALGGRLGQDTTAAAPLYQPDLAGRPRERVTDYQNDPFIIGIERRLRCTCGCNLDIYTCRTTDFTCTYSPALHRELVDLVEQHLSADEVVAAFVAKYGQQSLMAPPKEGFNWAGYLLPGVAITLVGSVLGWVLLRRARAPVAVGDAAVTGVLSTDDEARLRTELDKLES
ncbi:MAG: cytochrome c-type biogenesis protein CcmH [Gemmatimonadota bacterium]|nr:cytochrome c-type biogenesis protein CcmH [Gemmatimonadota bacterium]MDH5197031.1 cytochrome c-type biogenesis protein CcmH [Gemmatimonadota bacterium]